MNYCTNAYYPRRPYSGPILAQSVTNLSGGEHEPENENEHEEEQEARTEGGNFVTPEQAEQDYV